MVIRTSSAAQVVVIVFVILFLNGFCVSQTDVVSPMQNEELESLYSVIKGFVGNNWNGSGLYPDPCGWTPIQGVSCDIFDGLWYITTLNIGPVHDNSLVCTNEANFTSSLFNLKQLKTISIYSCFASIHPITIPSLGWTNLASSLETLELRSNKGLTGNIPVELSQLVNLESLVLIENSLSGVIPQELSKLAHLKRLSVEGNKLSGNIPVSLGYNLTDILILDLARNNLSGSIPSTIGSLTSLLKLDLSNNMLDGSIPKELGYLRKLTLLDLRNNKISGRSMQPIQNMASLQDLLLSNNPIGGNIMDIEFENLRNLTNLDLSSTGLDGMIPTSIAKLEKLRFIALDRNYFYGSVPKKLEALPSLHALRINGNKLSGNLEFSKEFYDRMGRRFASWGNPNLCYKFEYLSKENAPFGVNECKDENNVIDSNNKVAYVNVVNHSSFMASYGLYWEMVVFILALLL